MGVWASLFDGKLAYCRNGEWQTLSMEPLMEVEMPCC
jgi:hypothetical protein